jgi:alpha-galactosidase
MPRPNHKLIRIALLLSIAFISTVDSHAQTLAPTPPMGWNSWDAYGLSINETDFKANVTVLAGMKQLGWQYAVVDEGWYLEEPLATTTETQKFVYDANGRLIPALNRFPDAANGAGLKPLADWVHAQGLKFGIHLIRGIPRQSVKDDKPIAGSTFKASEAADTTDLCPWNSDNYGIKDNAAGQAWYDSMIGLYATWGIDYLKVDCISDRPYKISEIKQVAAAIKKTGRPIVLSLSPGPTNLSHAEEIAKYAQLWRISDDHWDVWSHVPEPGKGEFPMGTLQAFDRLAAWNKYNKPGSWPDEDMLPIGYLGPHPGWQEARESRLTHDEEQTEFTLWAISRSPLILGGNLTKLDDFTKSLITNKDLIAMNQDADDNQPIRSLPATFENIRAWKAVRAGWDGNAPMFVALFNLGDKPAELHFTWAELGLEGKEAKNLFGDNKSSSGKVDLMLPPHGSTVYSGLTRLGSREK